LVGFEFEARRGTISGIQISEGLRLVGFEFEPRRGTIGGIQISEGLRLVGFEFEARRGTIGGGSNIRMATIGWIHNSIVRT
jgi:hypothetical protein